MTRESWSERAIPGFITIFFFFSPSVFFLSFFSILRTWYELATAAYFPLDVGSPGRGDGGESRGSGQRDANTP